jgi:hypothetical protein
VTILLLIVIPGICGFIFLAQNAPRDWSLHWTQPSIAVASTSATDFSAVQTSQGYDAVWTRPNGSLVFSRFDTRSRRIQPDVLLKGQPEASSQSLTLGRSGSMDVAFWREDFNNGSRLVAAALSPNKKPVYHILATGTSALEHPRAFTAGRWVYVVFSWQRPNFDVYLAGITGTGAPVRPKKLTHAKTYAFNPHAAEDGTNTIQLLYMDACCAGSGMHMVHARYRLDGTPLGKPQILERIGSVNGGIGQGSTPDRWGLDVERDGAAVVAVWADDKGAAAAEWRGSRQVVPWHLSVAGLSSPVLTLTTSGGRKELIWQQQFNLGENLTTVELDRNLVPVNQPDRVTFEAAADDVPVGISLNGQPAVLWQASPTSSVNGRVESSRFSTNQLPAPSVWARLGLGLANPLGALFILVFGGLAVGMLLAVSNVLVIILLVGAYYALVRKLPSGLKWYAYAVIIDVILFALIVSWGAPTPPVLFLTSLSQSSGLLALGGALIFTVFLATTFLRRIDDVYRASAMALAALFFVGFMQALLIMQGQIAKI